ncbi:MAG: ferredoxin--NADP reductase [Acidimicrobiales bacterium]|jgi:ferredoxin-NADP reductase
MTDVDEVARRHAFRPLRVKQVVRETDDTRSFVLDVPPDLVETYRYRPGQFCTFRVRIGDDELFRCYSMSSAPDTDPDLVVTVKRVPRGAVSNWFNDTVSVGDLVDTSPPSGAFCLHEDDQRPVVAFCGGSGITPVLSIAKCALSSTDRQFRLFYANRDPGSVIFDDALAELESRAPRRCTVRRHVDSESGYPVPESLLGFAGGDLDAQFLVCGPGPFMDLVERVLLGAGVAPGDIRIERFETPDSSADPVVATDGTAPRSIVLDLQGRRHEIAYHPGDTVLETARRAGLAAPYSCESGNCATCMALVHEGSVTMRSNNALTPDEVAGGWVLTCQSVPTGPSLRIEYEDL